MTGIQKLKEKYGRNPTTIQRYNRAIREEIPAGNEVLDFMEWVHKVRTRGGEPPGWEAWDVVADKLHECRDEMVNTVKEIYGIED